MWACEFTARPGQVAYDRLLASFEGPMRASLSLAALIALGACSSDTAIVLAIHADEPEVKQATRLELFIGAGDVVPPVVDTPIPPAWWRRTSVTLDPGLLEMATGLGDATFELALTPGSGLSYDEPIVFAVAAYTPDGTMIGFAHAADFVRFAEGEIRRVDVPVPVFDPRAKLAGVTDTGCAWWSVPERSDPPPAEVRDRAIVPADDADCDNYRPGPAVCGSRNDCYDDRPDAHPGAEQDCSDDDTDCCPTTEADQSDADMDGWMVCAGDCLDSGAAPTVFNTTLGAFFIHPGQADAVCDGVDQACAGNGTCDGDVPDPDDDGYVTCRDENQVRGVQPSSCHWFSVPDCLESGEVAGVRADEIHPEADDQACDGVDQNCNGRCDEEGPADADMDGAPRCDNTGVVMNSVALQCGAAVADCDDGDPFELPGHGSPEQCDGLDFDCDGMMSTRTQACLPTVTVGSLCQIGTQMCTETDDGRPSASDCVAVAASPILPDGVCRPCAGSDDPLQCPGRFRGCGIHTNPVGGNQACLMPLQQIQVGSCVGTCTWSIENGIAPNGWLVTLVDANAGAATPPTGVLTGNAAFLRAIRTGPQGQGFIVKQTAGTEVTYQLYFFDHADTPCAQVVCTTGG